MAPVWRGFYHTPAPARKAKNEAPTRKRNSDERNPFANAPGLEVFPMLLMLPVPVANGQWTEIPTGNWQLGIGNNITLATIHPEWVLSILIFLESCRIDAGAEAGNTKKGGALAEPSDSSEFQVRRGKGTPMSGITPLTLRGLGPCSRSRPLRSSAEKTRGAATRRRPRRRRAGSRRGARIRCRHCCRSRRSSRRRRAEGARRSRSPDRRGREASGFR